MPRTLFFNLVWVGVLSCIVATPVIAQQDITDSMQKNLDDIAAEQYTLFVQSLERVRQYSLATGLPIFSYDDKGNLIHLIDIDQFGQPVYRTTFNAGAAITTGVVKLRSGGGLGLNLEGANVNLGIWDGGPVFDHVEFDTRVSFKENASSVSDHGSHVAGTMIGAGVNTLAKGMAPKANLRSYFWDNDLNEMANEASPTQTSLLISNHSYGLIQGWNCSSATNCTWFGNPSISTIEDWRFGFYTQVAKGIDEVAFNAPYYSIFWAAGNDRDDVNFPNTGGSNPAPPDGNSGTGFDSMGQEGTAKNILTIGAIAKVINYTSPSSVDVAGFSNWGPTDDGRIKPDLVAAGVSVFSSVSTPVGQTGSRYSTLSGTSMASPNAAGSLALLQELNKNLTGNYLRSASLKALAIHSAKEAGPGPGPDYMHGWGLLDVEAGAKVILLKDDQNVFIKELALDAGESFELLLNPKINTKMTATIVWTDPAGTPVGASLDPTNLMLVNDLDMRLVDDSGTRQFPWILNPDLGALTTSQIAQKGDNFRDNIEKIEFENPEQRNYKLVVTHKRTLAGGRQNFSLVLTYTSISTVGTAYYWVGGSGNYNDPSHWSLSSGGMASSTVPTGEDRVIIDENSSLLSGAIDLTNDVICRSITWLSKKSAVLNLNGYSLTVHGDMTISNNFLSCGSPGIIRFSGLNKTDNLLLLNNCDFSKASFEFEAAGTDTYWRLQGSPTMFSINLISGYLDLSSTDFTVNELASNSNFQRRLNLNNSKINGISASTILASPKLVFNTNKFSELTLKADATVIDWSNVKYSGTIKTNKSVAIIKGNNEISSLKVDGKLLLEGSNRIDSLELVGGAILDLGLNSTQTLNRYCNFFSSAINRIEIASVGISSILKFEGRYKVCFDFLTVKNVSVQGEAVINAGANSTILNSSQWATEDCAKILYPDFDVRYNCVNSLVEFIDKSTGDILNWSWIFNDANAIRVDEKTKGPRVIFSKPGMIKITQTISNNSSIQSFSKEIELKSNVLAPNSILVSGNTLASTLSSNSYQWLTEMKPISGATSRTFQFDGKPGIYNVLIFDQTCNILSSPLLISGDVDRPPNNLPTFYPNPSSGVVYFEVETDIEVIIADILSDIKGIYLINSLDKSINLENYSNGVYLIKIKSEKGNQTGKLIINR